MCDSFLRELETELLLMDLFWSRPELRRHGDNRRAEPFRPADVDVAPGDVGYEAPQRTGVEPDLVPGAHDLVEPAAMPLHEFGDLGAVDEILGGGSPGHDHHV